MRLPVAAVATSGLTTKAFPSAVAASCICPVSLAVNPVGEPGREIRPSSSMSNIGNRGDALVATAPTPDSTDPKQKAIVAGFSDCSCVNPESRRGSDPLLPRRFSNDRPTRARRSASIQAAEYEDCVQRRRAGKCCPQCSLDLLLNCWRRHNSPL